ncbi:hypothetical protein L249_0744 [Ophiocordyceps polyrhachis-furcata BCC 54312]|uniref:Uncharacterized protein n=1 Tax=Ophiocordyceps polyrhachis-furcata BCC 54312 TaxID=1330021 RepID=A0A367LCZ8_9HYPO|nr:hypothetical protein L249_0744 [Ophiocordyceps polyrhachis-furcata BCC 54312]
MPASRAKRPFAGAAADASQRQITSFFSSAAVLPSQQPSGLAASVRLPPSVQADLLSVGMRVRKSVPEGYKTASSSFKLWSDDGDGGAGTTPQASSHHTQTHILKDASAGSSRELLPFCGINRVGGLAFQDDPSYLAPPEALPSLTLSQETINDDEDEDDDDDDDDKILNPPGARKRSLPEDEDDVWSLPGQAYTPGWSSANARVKATPRHRAAAKGAGPAEDVGQENMVVDGDFSDADFLVYGGAEQEMDLSR